MLLVSFLVLLILSAFLYWQLKAFSRIRSVYPYSRQKISQANTPYIFPKTFKLNKYIIEKSTVCYHENLFFIGAFDKLLIWLASLAGIKRNLISNYFLPKIRFNILNTLMQRSSDAHYISDVNVQVKRIGASLIYASGSCTAIKLYPDTVFPFVFGHGVVSSDKEPRHIFHYLIIHILAAVAILTFTLKTWSDHEVNFIISQNHTEFEDKLWQNIQKPLEEKSVNYSQYKNIIANVNELFYLLPKPDNIANYDFSVLLINTDKLGIYILPSGKLVITLGLLKLIKSENALYYMMATEISHLASGNLLKAQGTNLIGMYWITKYLGHNILSRTLMRFYDFANIDYSPSEEESADKFALAALNQKYGHIGGYIDALRLLYTIENVDSDHLKQYLISENDIKQLLAQFAKENNFQIKDIKPFNFGTALTRGDIVFRPDETPLEMIKDIFSAFDFEFENTLNHYQLEVSQLNDILNFTGDISSDDIVVRINNVVLAKSQLSNYADRYTELLNKYEKQIYAISNNISEADRGFVLRAWEKEKSYSLTLSNFYINKYLQILTQEEVALRFLLRRVGEFTVDKKPGILIFKSPLTEQNYNQIISELDEIYNSKPPINEDKQ